MPSFAFLWSPAGPEIENEEEEVELREGVRQQGHLGFGILMEQFRCKNDHFLGGRKEREYTVNIG